MQADSNLFIQLYESWAPVIVDDRVDLLTLVKALGEKEKQLARFYNSYNLVVNLPIVVVSGDDFDRIRSLLARQEVDLSKPGVSSKTTILNNYAWNFGDADDQAFSPTMGNLVCHLKKLDCSVSDKEFTEKLLELLETDPDVSDEPTERELRYLLAKSATFDGQRIERLSAKKTTYEKEVK
jgi:hypothetical protein